VNRFLAQTPVLDDPPHSIFDQGRQSDKLLVIIEFPDMAALMGWYNSPEYSRLKAIREQCARTRIIALEGVAF